MPMNALDALHADLEAARYEMSSRTATKADVPAAGPAQHVAS